MCEVAGRIAVQFNAFHAKSLEQARHDDSADRIDSIEHDCEMCIPHGLRVHCRKRHHCIEVLISKIFVNDSAEIIHIAKVKVLTVSTFQNRLTFCCRKELTFFIQKFQCIPLSRVV